MPEPYLEPHQSRTAPSTEFEDRLGDAIEAAYAEGIHHLDGVLARLNSSGPPAPTGDSWTADNFTALMAELGR